MHGHHLTKKQAKLAQQKKNKYHMMLFQMMRQRQAEDARVKALAKSQKPAKEAASPNGEWTDKVAKVRNRLTGKQRESKERWNRFAGTSDGGGRGL